MFDAPVTHRPALADGTVYVAAGTVAYGQDRSDQTGPLVALAAADGEIRWETSLSQPPADYPRTHDGDCYLATGTSNGIAGVDQHLRRFGAGGSEQWDTDPVDSFLHLLGFGDGTAYLGTSDDEIGVSGQSLFGTALADGSREWEIDAGDATRGWFHDGQLLVESGMRSLAAHDPADGTERWFFEGEPLYDSHRRLARADGTAFVEPPGDARGIASLDLADGSTGWSILPEDVPTFTTTGAATDGDHLVVTEYGGYVLGVDPADGTELWRFRANGETRDEPVLGDGVTYVGTHGGSVYALDAATGEKQWSRPAGGRLTRLSIDGGNLVAFTSPKESGGLVSFDASDGTERWRYETSADLTRPVLGPEHVYVVDEREGAVLALAREQA